MKFLRGLILLSILIAMVWLLKAKPQSESSDLIKLSFEELKSYFTNLSNTEGAKEAFEVLKNVQVAPGTDMHLLGHVVGDILYKQEGADGIKSCTQDFRNACSHSIVVGLFTDKGEDALIDIRDACKKAPGGRGAYTMCYHGLGHGILAYTGYEFPETVKLCQKTKAEKGGEFAECVSGAVMEIISGGGHDKNLWSAKRPQTLKKDDPFYICSLALLPEEVRERCYDYITPFLWEVVGADINNPKEEDFINSFKLCDGVAEEKYRNVCFGGFGKEFVGLAQSRDIRRVDQIPDDSLKKVVYWCNLAHTGEGKQSCLSHALSSIFWGGENDYSASIRFCNVIPDPEHRESCFHTLLGQVDYYIKDGKIKAKIWEDITEAILKNQGVEAAFNLVDYLYKNDPLFASDCHSYVHLVGEKAYGFYSRDRHFKLSSKAASCGYGFYHGFMETLLTSGEDIKKAGQFCSWAKNQVGGKNDVEGACFHGIGHGLTENHDIKKWADEKELTDNALKVCETVTEDEYMINRCASGVFNVLAIKYNLGALSLNKNDPLNFCRKQTVPYFKKPCFEEMNTLLISISGGNLPAAAAYLDSIEENEYAVSAMRSLAGVVGMGATEDSFPKHIRDCRSLQVRFHTPCIKGLVAGLIEAQTSSQEEKAFFFCGSPQLSIEESASCREEAQRLLSLYQ